VRNTEADPRPTVLVIDDDEISRTLAIETLTGHGWRLTELSSPIGASRLVDEEQIDVVVLDVEMSGLRGDKLAKLFRENRRFTYVGVVLISARHEAELQSLGSSCGADSVVDKRNMRSNLLPAVRMALQASAKRRRDAPARPGKSLGSLSDNPREAQRTPRKPS
jgi:two-component system torCAD operon response regulator TorR